MSYWRDEEFQERLLMFVCRDRNFLKETSGILSAKDFEPKRGEGSQEAFILARKAFEYWQTYKEPIGGMLKTEVLDYIREHKRKMGSRQRDKLLSLAEKIRKAEGLVAVEAIKRKVVEYKQRQAQQRAIKELIDLKEKGELTQSRWRRICKEALENLDENLKVSNYSEADEIEKRIKRREKNSNNKFPFLMIDPIDKLVQTFPRGEIGIGLAKYKTGKSTLACHLDQAYALQGYNVLHYTLEDNADMVEDRLDASFTGIKLKRLTDRSDKLKRRLRKKLARLRGKIKVIDGTDGGMTVQRIEEVWENYRNQGFAADLLVIDYDEGIVPGEHYKGDSGERKESMEIYRALKTLAAKRQLWIWVFAQTRRGKPGQRKMIVNGDDSAIDISKARRCAMMLGIGDGPEEWGENSRYINVALHRYDRGGRGAPIMGDFERSIFYSREDTEKAMHEYSKKNEDE